MYTFRKNCFFSLALASGMLLSQYGLAGAADVLVSDGNKMKYEYTDDKLRITLKEDESSYMIFRDEHMYIVSSSDGNLMVIDANQALSMFSGMAGAAAPSAASGEVLSLDATGKMEKHAGIIGEVYKLRYKNQDGKEEQAELVLADDDRARAFREAMKKMVMSMAKSLGKDYELSTNNMQSKLSDLDMGVLRYGKDMTVTAISDRKVDEARFVLPAEPTDLSSLGGLMGQSKTGGDGEPQSGGLLSGLLGAMNKSKEAPEEGTDSEEAEEPAEKSSAASELGKALGGFFGR
jgi:hypothetical protein